MPKGKPSGQTMATERYRAKMGIITKGFKIKKELADAYAEACAAAGVSQTSQIVKMMQEFIDSQKGDMNGKG